MAQIVVVLSPAAAGSDAQPVLRQIERAVETRVPRATVQKMHHGRASPELDVFFEVDAPDDHAHQVVEDLLRVPGVDGAYVKPRDEAP
jgi:hypothetical protein